MQTRFACLPARGESTSKAILTEHSVNAVSRIQILDDDHLVAGSRALTRGDDGPGEEEFPNLSNISGDCTTKEKGIRTLYHLGPYLALIASTFPTQLRYHLQSVPE
jgi:hypothetical protein